MQTLIELAPLIAFFAVWAKFGIYAATAVLMGAMALLIAWDWLRTRRVPPMHLVSAILVWVFGAATLLLHDMRFIQVKATVFYWLLAIALAGSIWIGKKPILERLMGAALPEGATVPPERWRSLSLVYATFYVALGAANLYFAFATSEKTWVIFKAWVTVPLIFVFTIATMFWLLRGQTPGEPAP